MTRQDSRETLLRRVSAYGFALDDVKLFLDGHPSNRDALNYFHEMKKQYKQAVQEFSALYGPLTANDVESTEYWTWVQGPWPWESEE